MKGQVAIVTQPMTVTIASYDLPRVESGGVLLEVIRTNVCGSEIHMWKGLHSVKPNVLGHEMVGRIVALGSDVKTDYAGNPVKVGDRVAPVFFVTCRKCTPCQMGKFNLCENAFVNWLKDANEPPHFHGSFATHYYIHSDQYFYKVPDNVPDSAASSANCALSQVYFGIEKAALRYGETILIQGAGGLGLNASAVAKEFGATVIVIDRVTSRLEIVKRFGADYVIDMNEYDTVDKRINRVMELTDGKGVDVGIDLTGIPEAFSEAVHLVRPSGRLISIGNSVPGADTIFDPGLLTRKSIHIIPVVRYDPWYLNKALGFISKTMNKYPFDDIVDAEFTLSEIKEALDRSVAREVTRASIVARKN